MPISDVVTLAISIASSAVSQAGFGTPLILGYHTRYTSGLVRTYSSLAAMAADGFLSTDPEYVMAQAILAQNPQVTSFKVGRLTTAPSFAGKLTPTAVNSFVYSVDIKTPGGTKVTATYTSDGSATIAEICTGLSAAITALAVSGLTATDNTTYIGLAGTAGKLFSFYNFSKNGTADVLDFEDTSTDTSPTMATQLDAIVVEDDNWYWLCSTWGGLAQISAIAAWLETKRKLFMYSTVDTRAHTSATNDVLTTLKNLSYARSGGFVIDDKFQYAGGAFAGKVGPLIPGEWTGKFKTLSGVTVPPFTDTAIANVKAKNGNAYQSIGGVSIVADGKVASGEYIDVIQFIDWVYSQMTENIYALLVAAKKVPLTDAGIAQIEKEIRAVLDAGIKAGGFAADPAPVITVPRASALTSADKSARRVTGITFSATLAGAIHLVSISGTVSL
jgi:hypothetical protein